MWIRSQNKCYLINCKNVIAYENIKMNKFVVITNDGTDIILGTYSTKEKVLKVMDLITDAIDHQHISSTVFQMP